MARVTGTTSRRSARPEPGQGAGARAATERQQSAARATSLRREPIAPRDDFAARVLPSDQRSVWLDTAPPPRAAAATCAAAAR